VLRTIAQQIPGLVPGIFFFAWVTAGVAASSLDLAVDLFAEEDWGQARTEALRVAYTLPDGQAHQAQLLASVSGLRAGMDRTRAEDSLRALWQEESAELELRSMAAYELGLAEWADGGTTNVLEALSFSYLHARQPSLFWRAGCSLYFFLKQHKALRQQESVLWSSLQSCRDAWPLEVWRECRPAPKAGSSVGSLPGKWVVQFYRTQISPAIGSRCDLLPSCSEYFLQASRAHGLLGIPIMADRFIREPSVVSAAEKPVVMPDGHIRLSDPLSDHDSWLR
jgi:putative component of membrane protein insertase Oxa1/YidC/SpoIIIJ protein YidD